jgi:hypothetical protein
MFLLAFPNQTLRSALIQFDKAAILYIVFRKAKEEMASSGMKWGIVWNVYTNTGISLTKMHSTSRSQTDHLLDRSLSRLHRKQSQIASYLAVLGESS